MPYTIPQREDLEAAMMAAFNYDTLARPFQNELGKRLDHVVVKEAFDVVIAKLIDWCGSNGYERPLVRMMQESVPANELVIAFFDHHHEFPALLSPGDRENLRIALFSVLPTYQDLRSFIQTRLHMALDEIVGGVPALDAPTDSYLRFIIRWADHFDRAQVLIESALTQFPDAPVLHKYAPALLDAIVRRRPKGLTAYEDAFTACDLGGILLIDREPLRNALRGFVSGPKPRVIAVNGPSRSGKSHSLFYIMHVSEKQHKYEAVAVDLKQEAPATFRPNELVRSIIRQMGRNKSVQDIPKKEDSSTEPRWVRDLADFVVGEIRDTQKLWVIVLDGFDAPNLDRLTRELVRELVLRAAREPLLRVVLLQYSDDLLPPEAAGRLDSEPISAITEEDLRQFLLQYARAQGEAPPSRSLDVIVANVLEGMRTRGPERNEEIANRVSKWLSRLEQPL